MSNYGIMHKQTYFALSKKVRSDRITVGYCRAPTVVCKDMGLKMSHHQVEKVISILNWSRTWLVTSYFWHNEEHGNIL